MQPQCAADGPELGAKEASSARLVSDTAWPAGPGQ